MHLDHDIAFAALHLPEFRLQCRLRLDNQGLQAAAILVEDVTKNCQVLEANKAARSGAVVPGITYAQALSRYPDVRIFASCFDSEIAARQLLQNLCLNLSPNTEETRPGLYIMDLSGHQKLSPRSIALRFLKQVDELGLAAQIAFAPSADIAELACQHASSKINIITDVDTFLKSCPISHATQNQDLLDVFELWGIKTLGAFTQIPIEAVNDRFGKAGLELWERAMGRKRRLLRIQPEVPTFCAKLELEYSLHTLEPLLFIIRRFIEDLCRQLAAAHLLAAKLHLKLALEDSEFWEKSIELPEPICARETLFSVLEKSLETAQTDSAITGISLRIDPIEPTHQQSQIFETAIQNPWRLADTVDRLAALVGEKNVGTPVQLDTHRPDSFILRPLEHSLSEERVEETQALYGPPMRRYRPPRPIQVSFAKGQLSYLKSPKLRGKIIATRGPFEISGDWWDQQFWKQTEWDVQLQNKQIYRISQTKEGWFLEGRYG